MNGTDVADTQHQIDMSEVINREDKWGIAYFIFRRVFILLSLLRKSISSKNYLIDELGIILC